MYLFKLNEQFLLGIQLFSCNFLHLVPLCHKNIVRFCFEHCRLLFFPPLAKPNMLALSHSTTHSRPTSLLSLTSLFPTPPLPPTLLFFSLCSLKLLSSTNLPTCLAHHIALSCVNLFDWKWAAGRGAKRKGQRAWDTGREGEIET